MNTAKVIAERLAEQAIEVAQYLYPQGKRQNKYWLVGSVNGEPGQSLKICLQGSKKGRWTDFATDHHGDLIDLWMHKQKISCAETLKEAKQWLGISEPKFVAPSPKNYVKPKKDFQALNPDSAVFNYLKNERCLSLQILMKFKISEKNDYVVFLYYHNQDLLMTKYLHIKREDGKKKMFVESNSQPCLFGWQAISNTLREITLTEGEIDAMTLHQYGLPALSLPFGGGAGDKHRWIDHEFDRLAVFDKIYLCFDNDEVGRKTLEAVIDRLGRHRCYIVTLPEKDANACLQKRIPQKIIDDCFQSAKTQDPAELKAAPNYLDKVMDLFYPSCTSIYGYYSPWQKTKEYIAFRPNELSVWTGINGHGKSQFLGFIVLQCMLHGARVCIASLEMKPERLLMRLTRQVAAVTQPDESMIRQIHDWYADKLWLFDLVGTAKTERLLEVFLYARQRYGIDVFLIDSLLKCSLAEDDYNSQKIFIEQLCDFKNEHPCHIHVVAHPRKGIDEESIPGKLDIKGTGSITDLADNCFTVWRNKTKNTDLEADCIWTCHKQRHGDWEGKVALWYDEKCYHYLEQHRAKAVPLIELSKLDQCNFNTKNTDLST